MSIAAGFGSTSELQEQISALRAEIARLEEIYDTIAQSCVWSQYDNPRTPLVSRLMATYDAQQQEIASLRAELKKEAARIEWIEHQDFDELSFTMFQDQPNDGKCGVSIGAGWCVGNTLREAIDAAMEQK